MKARFCGCNREPLPSSPGDRVYIKSKGVLTLNAKEAHKDYPDPIGEVDPQHRLKLSPAAEQAMSLL